jgi:hypothetical protein
MSLQLLYLPLKITSISVHAFLKVREYRTRTWCFQHGMAVGF